jgi:hypothetical protein
VAGQTAANLLKLHADQQRDCRRFAVVKTRPNSPDAIEQASAALDRMDIRDKLDLMAAK